MAQPGDSRAHRAEYRSWHSSLPQSGQLVRQDKGVLDASSFAGPYAGYGWLLAVLAVGLGLSILRRLIRLALVLGLVAGAVLLWRSGALAG